MTGWNIHFQVNGFVWALRDTSPPPESRQKQKYAGLLLQNHNQASDQRGVSGEGQRQSPGEGEEKQEEAAGGLCSTTNSNPTFRGESKDCLTPALGHPPSCSESAHQPWGETQLLLWLIYFKMHSLGTDAVSRALRLMSRPPWADIASLFATIPGFAQELGFHPNPLLTAQVMWWGRQWDLGTLEILSCTCWGEQEYLRNVSVQQKITSCDLQ